MTVFLLTKTTEASFRKSLKYTTVSYPYSKEEILGHQRYHIRLFVGVKSIAFADVSENSQDKSARFCHRSTSACLWQEHVISPLKHGTYLHNVYRSSYYLTAHIVVTELNDILHCDAVFFGRRMYINISENISPSSG